MMAPVTTVSSTASTGDSSAMRLECSARFSSTSGMAFLLDLMLARHQQTDLLHRQLTCRIGFRELAARDDRNAVGDLEDLVEILADDQDRRAGARQIHQR